MTCYSQGFKDWGPRKTNIEKTPHYPVYDMGFKGESNYSSNFLDSPRCKADMINPVSKIKLGLGVKRPNSAYASEFASPGKREKERMIYQPQEINKHE